MRIPVAVRRLWAGALSMLALILLALAPAGIATAGDVGTGLVSTETPTEVPGGVVPPTEAPRPTEEPVPTDDRTNEGIAPGSVVLVLITSDGGLVPGGTTACVGEVCQTLSSDTPSGFKWEFDRITNGWQEVQVRTSSPYEGAVASVQVHPGQTSQLQVALTLVAQREEAPTGPVRDAPSPPREAATGRGESDPEGTSQFGVVTSLPVTGAGDGAHPRGLLVVAGSIAGVVLAGAFAGRRVRRA